jgi:hypothetical protein
VEIARNAAGISRSIANGSQYAAGGCGV